MKIKHSQIHSKPYSQLGFTLIELMFAVTIGSFLILGAAFAFQEARKTYSVNDTIARLQEQAQFVLDVLEEDVRLSNFWGLHNNRSIITKDAGLTTLIAGTINGDCVNDWSVDTSVGISGTNDLNPATDGRWGTNCIDSGGYKIDTDTLVIRHADPKIAGVTGNPIVTGKIYLSSSEVPEGTMYVGTAGSTLAGLSAISKIYAMRSHGYYVRDWSFVDGDNIPMLRRVSLTVNSAAPSVEEQELALGVEDLQIEFGIDTSAFDSNSRGSINRYVTPDNTDLNLANVQILSVRIWVLMRAQNDELNYLNTNTYSYGNKIGTDAYTPNSGAGDGFRRLLVSRTFHVRNMQR